MSDLLSSHPPRNRPVTSKAGRPRLALALQGGGAHGAYGWGVLERLLDEDIEIVAVSGASAGALNGTALVAGLAAGGRAGALAGLERLWKTVSDTSPLRAFDHQWGGPLFEPWFRRTLEVSKMMSRYVAQVSPQLRGMRALRQVVSSSIDLGALTRDEALPLYIAATAVSNGAARLFGNDEITVDAIMASACLPDLFAAVTIDGQDYWDGGFSANPALEPLIFADHGATDLLIVQITPFAVDDTPTSLGGIVGRMSDIGFNACLLRDLKALTDVQTIARSARSTDPAMQALAATNLHMMPAPLALGERGSASKLDTRWSKIQELRELGRATASAWLDENAAQFRRSSTLTEDDLPEAVAA
ncbi:patatin-like phospholipase family protein [Sphingomonas sp. CFBP8993]|uniref:patatin-like phospholipase family protein n=1 Tax=Sphingomonas sp. CFBP8993 TaxID=3096526 RepID=UPI002A69EC76|nr:patatin-like phospholipase family protein [Sphingomonas sp. CFBP8993]MDY0957916.1 patatin-like phospholipase family protein [Sphingomonas sp. CFBP8993]